MLAKQQNTSAIRLVLTALVMIITLSNFCAHAWAEEEVLVAFGEFGLAGAIGSTVSVPSSESGIETYHIICNQRSNLCQDNLGNAWLFGETLEGYVVALCDKARPDFFCAQRVQIDVRAAKNCKGVTLSIEKTGNTELSILEGRNFLGSVHSPLWAAASYGIGRIHPGRRYVFVVEVSGDCEEGFGTCPRTEWLNGILLSGIR